MQRNSELLQINSSAGPKGGQKGHMPPRSDHKAYLAPRLFEYNLILQIENNYYNTVRLQRKQKLGVNNSHQVSVSSVGALCYNNSFLFGE